MIYRSVFLNVVFWGLLIVSSCIPKHPVIGHNNSTLIDPAIVYGSLSNGFQYILMENSTPEDRVDIHLNIYAGSMHESDNQQGVAHYLEHMLFNGSEHFKPGELIEYFQSIGMDFGGDANAHTSFFNTVYDLSLPKADQKHMDDAFVIIQDYAKGALLLETEVDRERGIILAEKRERDSVSYRTFKESLNFELPGSIFNQRWPIGKDSVLKKADRKLLKAYYDQWYQPNNMTIIVVGDFDAKAIEPMIVKRFSKLKPRSSVLKKPIITKWKEHHGTKAFYHYEPEAGNTQITIEAISWKPFEEETIEIIKDRTINRITNSMLQNRLSRMVSKQTADFSDASVYTGSFWHYISLSAINATCDPDKWKESLHQIENTLRQGLLYGFDQKELNRVKSDYISSLENQVSRAETRKTKTVAKQILTTINRKGLLLSPQQRKDILKPYIESITLQDANEKLKQAWSKNHRLLLVTGNLDINANEPQTVILEEYQKSLTRKVNQYKGFESKAFPYLKLPSLNSGIKTRKDNVKDLGVTTIEFNNNIRLNLKKTDFEKNKFLFKVCFGQGEKAEIISKPGLAYISENILKASGLGRLDSDQLEESLAGKKVSIGFDILDNYFSLSGSGDPSEAELVFQLIYHYLKDPGYRPEPLNLIKTRYTQQYDGLLRTPEGIMRIKGDLFLAKNDHRFGLPVPGIINQYSLTDIKNWLNPYFQNAPIEISVVGDFDPENIIHLAKKYMGTFIKRNNFPNKPIDPGVINFPFGEKVELTVDTKIDSGVVHVAFPTDDFWDIMQTRKLSILSRVFSERLRVIIREELGEAYSPYVYNDPSINFDGYGVLHVVVTVKPENHDFVYNKIKEIIHSLSSKGITKKEADFALKPVLNHLKVIRKTNGYWLNSVMANVSNYPQKFDWANNMIAGYSSISNDDLTALAKKYLDIQKSALIIIQSETNIE
ncbi:MAG: insulinase family protein [Desulfobacteraceae bacterium]|nr:insulinase family protein [Desulfobacteraceae bacterium]